MLAGVYWPLTIQAVGRPQKLTCMIAMWPLSSRPCTLKMAASPSIHRRAMSNPERTRPPGLFLRSSMKPSAPVPCWQSCCVSLVEYNTAEACELSVACSQGSGHALHQSTLPQHWLRALQHAEITSFIMCKPESLAEVCRSPPAQSNRYYGQYR